MGYFMTEGLSNDRIDGEDQKIVPKQCDVPVTSYLDVCKLFINKSAIGQEKHLPSVKQMLSELIPE